MNIKFLYYYTIGEIHGSDKECIEYHLGLYEPHSKHFGWHPDCNSPKK
jgi:hypothetical protein